MIPCWAQVQIPPPLLGSGGFFQKSPGSQVDSGQPLSPGSKCSVLSGNATGDVVSLTSSACHCCKWRGQLTAHPVDATLMHPGVLLSVIRDGERGDVGRG